MKHFLTRTFLLALIISSGTVYAVTLGHAKVKSFLGQPLEAEIDLIGLTAGQHEDLRLRIANDQHFKRLGISYTQFLSALTFDVAQLDGRWIVRARSKRPVTEPFVDFPLQMTWPGGQLIKQYTLLLDPPRRIQPARAARTSRAAPATRPAASQLDAGTGDYGPVRSGESLWPIAKQLKPSGVTTRQMAMALLRANPHAFIGGNMNRLRTGVTLAVPQRAVIEQVDAASARAEFAAQTRSWQAPVATSPRIIEAPVGKAAVVQPKPEPSPQEAEKPPLDAPAKPEPENDSQLRIVTDSSKSDIPAGSQQNLQEQLLVTMEEIESNRITTDAIETRLARMEAELTRMQKLVELKDAQIAAMQSEAAERQAIQTAAQTAEPPSPPPATIAGTVGVSPPPAPKAPVSIERMEALPTDVTAAPARPWYEEYLWAVWVALGLMGLVALLMLLRRQSPAANDAPVAELPVIGAAGVATASEAEAAQESDRLREAEEDFRRLAEQQLAETAAEVEQELPELEISANEIVDEGIHDGVTDALLRETLNDEDKRRAEHTDTVVRESDFNEDDIASWVAELGDEAKQPEAQSANDEKIPLDDDIPSILTELDDQLSAEKPADTPTPAPIQLEPVSDTAEDDTFSMSLDLARAYLEIGDQDGAKDMLEQALAGARDPDHRRQIEELLAQID